ncbi:uncharacterized protein SCHCODRAFT_02570897 [Schizophyllum commune H4-8]|uniref:F-box domain-containing protein n=1 Tax=Schizophyllum commune (strain H4-8 / FGSC 9210) TaxID=578458 RepID=D8PYC3_SCHCM|nr:uncharacterized protein SCHCODRAFT_02570897 [Schizophyllum commune H4-8]KAI5897265.1 hypothetical protein SCHCODRAFT_02570897 [Schizophyllum commune H4-8]
MKATAALEGLTSQSQRLATLDIYRTNHNALTSDLTTRLEELTANMEKTQSTLIPAISRLHQILRDADQVLRDADEQIRLNKAMTAPWRRLPPEILAEIFVFVAPTPPPPIELPWERFSNRYHRYHFADVCRVWRSVALDTAQLWSSLCSKDGVTALECKLRRTKQSPLNPNNVGCLPDSVSCAALETLGALLGPVVSADDDNQPSSEVLLFSDLRDALNVRRVDLDICYSNPVRSRFPECWRLSYMSLCMYDCSDPACLLLELLEQVTPTLEVLKVELLECDAVIPHSFPYHFSRLRELHFCRDGFTCLGFIEAPVLEFMRLREFLVDSEQSDAFLQALDNVSQSEVLSKLAIDDAYPDSTVLKILRKLPQLEWLRLESNDQWEYDLASEIFDGLTRGGVPVDGVDTPPNALCPLPNLRYLSIDFSLPDNDADEVVESLRRLALSRHPSVSDQEDEEGVSLRPLDVFYANAYTADEDIDGDLIPTWGEFQGPEYGWNCFLECNLKSARPRADLRLPLATFAFDFDFDFAYYTRAFHWPRPRHLSSPMVTEYRPASECASQEQALQEHADAPPLLTDAVASDAEGGLRVDENGGPHADEGDVCVPSSITDTLKIEKSKLVVETWLGQQDEQQTRCVNAQSDAESSTEGPRASDEGAANPDDDQATLLAVPLKRHVRDYLTIESLREVARSVRGSTAMAARSVNRRSTVDSLRDFAHVPSATPEAPATQGPNERAG